MALLIHALNDSRFIDHSKTFGVELIAWVIQQPETEENFKKLVVKTLQDPRVRAETIQIVKYLTDQKETEEIVATYMKQAFLRKDVLDELTLMLVKGAKQTIEDKEA
jgi:hypothetical protein